MLRQIANVVFIVSALGQPTFAQSTPGATLTGDDHEVLRTALSQTLSAKPEFRGLLTRLIDVTLPVCGDGSRMRCVDRDLLDAPLQSDVRSRLPAWAPVDYPNLREAFMSRNARPWRLGTFLPEPAFALGSESSSTVTTSGFVQFSAPGYSLDRRFALVYMTAFCGVDCGWGTLVALERTSDSWRVLSSGPGWIS